MFRTDLWVAAFVRRQNDLGNFCVVSRRGDPIAGQIFIEHDHLNGTVSLFVPAPSGLRREEDREDRVFQLRFGRVEPQRVSERIAREADFDPDLWVVSLESRAESLGLTLVG